MKPRLAFTMGDPAGVGPELCVHACRDPEVLEVCEPVVVGPWTALRQAAEFLGQPVPKDVEDIGGLEDDFPRGRVDANCGLCAYRALTRGIDMAMLGEVHGLVTAPLNKAAMNLAGIHEPGHTEILAKLTDSPRHALMLYSERLAVVFATCHQSLSSVPESLSSERVVEVAELIHEALIKIRGGQPKIGLLALNPHAGEDGLFGREETDLLVPAVREARSRGLLISDPIPPDTAFTSAAIGRYDGYVALYHDQGGIPFKMLSFEDGVNITLGLPIIRTSVDHGTAFDIAWQGKASVSSMRSAVQLAAKLATRRL